MNKANHKFVDIATRTLPWFGPVYEFGSYQVQGDFTDIRPYFDCEFVGCDMRSGPGVDAVLDFQKPDLPNECAGTVVSLNTLEHVERPRQAVQEAWRILKPGGILIISSVMRFKIHEFPNDYWRFTPQGFKSLLNCFEGGWTGWSGKKDFPHTVVGVGFKESSPNIDVFQSGMKVWREKYKKPPNKYINRIRKLLR